MSPSDGAEAIDDLSPPVAGGGGVEGRGDPWDRIVRSVEGRRSYDARFFKPVLLVGVIDLVEEGLLDPSRMTAALVVGRFCETVGCLQPSRADQGWRPFWHLSNDRVWIFSSGGTPVDRSVFGPGGKPGTPSRFYDSFTEVSVPAAMLPFWRDADARGRLRSAMIAMLAAGDEECRLFATLLSEEPAPPTGPPTSRAVSPRRSGQGFRSDADVRRAVELRAMEMARVWLEAERWSVEDVSGSRSYDFHCTRGAQVLYVEVRGTTGQGDDILLTAAEVEFARARQGSMALAVASGIFIEADPFAAKGGVLEWRFGWAPAPHDLSPVSYVCSLRDRVP